GAAGLASASKGAAARGVNIPGNVVLMVFRNDYAVRMLAHHSQQQLDDIAWKLNTRPRKSLDWKCPAELFLSVDAFDFKTYWADKLGLVALGH
ncbi:hypothetical protein M5G27_31970, partial [Pseudomonas shahriarae]|nr:hypothetical protein [Pseudomonas shahriarae]